MRVHKGDGLKKKSFTPEQLERLEQRTRKTLLDMRLRELRKIAGVTQASLAKRLKVSQGQISETENREDVLVSTLRRYVAALGGEIEVVARFGDKSLKVSL
jgi:transcriptional regulator with XRE-family HTH domain